ncbi:6,7-dimethyl-8-ribityllumazine synthase [Saccharospirillum alexandrii]|uniref:6,7-dimethyl-8-ribityllumazine synthase n=1 Tax=Saccharospirillum alexandrii TaxID=2448477 RepID=UPI003735DEE6
MNQSIPNRTTRVAVIAASWHADIVGQACASFESELKQLDTSAEVEHLRVPGAYEIPLHAKHLAKSGRFDAIVACGLVVDGGIYRHDFVAQAVIDGLMRVQLDTDVAVFSVVLTPHHFHEHEEHQRYFREHFVKKGQEAAQACHATLGSLRAITG